MSRHSIISRATGICSIAVALFLTLTASQAASEDCDRACLRESLNAYLDGVFKNDPAAAPLAENYYATENTAPIPRGLGAWQSVTGYGEVQRRYLDAYNQTAAYFGLVKKDGKDQIVSVRIRVADRKVTEAEWIFGTQGPGQRGDANPAGLVKYAPPKDVAIPVSERSSRFVLIGLANNYWQAVVEKDGSWVPNTDQCIRIENGGGSTGGDLNSSPPVPTKGACLDGFHRFKGVTKDLALRRIPVVDEEAGVVMGIAIFVRNPGSNRADNLVHEYWWTRNGKIDGVYTSMHFLPMGSPVTTGWENR